MPKKPAKMSKKEEGGEAAETSVKASEKNTDPVVDNTYNEEVEDPPFVVRRSTRRSVAKQQYCDTDESRPGSPGPIYKVPAKKTKPKGKKKNLESSDESGRSSPEEARVLEKGSVFRYNMQDLLTRPDLDKPHLVTTLEPEDFTEQYFEDPGLLKPILFSCTPQELGMKMPDAENFDVDDIVRLVGEKRSVEVVKVEHQEAGYTSMEKMGEYYKNPKGEMVNLLSCEFSTSPLRDLICGPELIRTKLDMVETHFPDELKRRHTKWESHGLFSFDNLFPQVQNYALLSVEGCFTDFHVDFGGTSVWYHVLKGEKVFWLIPPTENNLTLYDYFTNKTENVDFMGIVVTDCHRLVIKAGQTAILPSGWIHAVYTPKKSIVFGGNFLHTRSCATQCRISTMEIDISMHDRYKMPYFEELHFFMLADWVKWCTGRLYLRPIFVDDTFLYVGKDYVESKGYMVAVDPSQNKRPAKGKKKKNRKTPTNELEKQEAVTPSPSPSPPPKTMLIDYGGPEIFYDPPSDEGITRVVIIHAKFNEEEDELEFIQEWMEKITKRILVNFEALLDFIHTRRRFHVPDNISRPESLVNAFAKILAERRRQLEARGIVLAPPSTVFSDRSKQKQREARAERKKKRELAKAAEVAQVLLNTSAKKEPKPRTTRNKKSSTSTSASSSRPVTPFSKASSKEPPKKVSKNAKKEHKDEPTKIKVEESAKNDNEHKDTVEVKESTKDTEELKVTVTKEEAKDEVLEAKAKDEVLEPMMAEEKEEDDSDMEEFIVDEEVAKINAKVIDEGLGDVGQANVRMDVFEHHDANIEAEDLQEEAEDEARETEPIVDASSVEELKEALDFEVPMEIDVPMDASEVIGTEDKEVVTETKINVTFNIADTIKEAKDNSVIEAPDKVDVQLDASGATEADDKEEVKGPDAKDDTYSNQSKEATASETPKKETAKDKMKEGEEQVTEVAKEAPAAEAAKVALAAEAEKETKASPTKTSPKKSPQKDDKNAEEEDEERKKEKEKKRKEKEQKRIEKEIRKVDREVRRKEKEKKQREKEKKKKEAEKRKSFDEALGAPDKKKKKNDKPQFVGGLPMAPIQHEPVVPNLYNYDPMAEIMQLGTGQLHSTYRKSRNTVAPPMEKKFYKLEHKPSEEKREGDDHPAGSTTPVYSGRDVTPPHSPSQAPAMVTTPAPLNYGQRRSTFSDNATTSGVFPYGERRTSFDNNASQAPRQSAFTTPMAKGRPAPIHSPGTIFMPPSERGASVDHGWKSLIKPYNESRSSFEQAYNSTHSSHGTSSPLERARSTYGQPYNPTQRSSGNNSHNERPRSSYGHNYHSRPVTPSSSHSVYTPSGDRPPSTDGYESRHGGFRPPSRGGSERRSGEYRPPSRDGSERRSGEYRPPSRDNSERRYSFGRPLSVQTFTNTPPVAQRPSPNFWNPNTVPQHRYSPGIISPNTPPPMGLELPPFLQQERQVQEPESRGHITAMEMVAKIRRNVRRMREQQADM